MKAKWKKDMDQVQNISSEAEEIKSVNWLVSCDNSSTEAALR